MEFACRGRPTAAGDIDDSRPHRFSDPQPPPPHGDGDLLAARRREELMWELHKERIRQDMILRELAETERAMAARFGPPDHWPLQALPPSQDYWHHRRPPSLPPWDEAAPRPPGAMTEHPPCSSGSPAAVRPPPVYPHVERSPSPVPRPSPADDGGQQLPGAAARPMLSGDLEGCRSPSKRTLSEGALVPAAANAGAGTTMSVSFAEEVTPGDRRAVGGEPKHCVEDGHGVQPLSGSGNQSSEQRETAESTVKDRSDEELVRPCQDGPASQENGASDEQKRIAFREPTPQAEGFKRKLTTGTSPVTTRKQKKQKPPRSRRSRSQVIFTPSPHNLVEHRAGKRHLSKLKARNKPAEATLGGSRSLGRNGNGSVAENGGGGGNAPRPAEDDEDQEPAQSRWACLVCDAKCNSKSSLQEHLGGRLHRENTEAILAKFRSSYSRKSDDPGGKSLYYCKACDVRCTGDTMLASHLVGRRHRRKALEGRKE